MGVANLYVIALECSHTIKFRGGRDATPKIGEEVLCIRCDGYRLVTESPNESVSEEYKARCHDCHYTRRYGMDKDTAIIAISRHVRGKRHSVDLLFCEELVTTYCLKDSAQLVLL